MAAESELTKQLSHDLSFYWKIPLNSN